MACNEENLVVDVHTIHFRLRNDGRLARRHGILRRVSPRRKDTCKALSGSHETRARFRNGSEAYLVRGFYLRS